MRRIIFCLFFGAALCGACRAEALAFEFSDIYESVSDNTVSDNDVNIDMHSSTLATDRSDWDVLYYDYIDTEGNPVTKKVTKFLDDKTLFITDEDYLGGLSAFASYNTYYGLLGTSYIELFRGLATKLGFMEHYVCSRVGQYEYIFAHSDTLKLSGTVFSGTNVRVFSYNTQSNGYITLSTQSSFTLNASNYVVYSDLGTDYPSLIESDGVYAKMFFFLFAIVVIGYFINSFFVSRGAVVRKAVGKKREVY